MQEAPCRSGGAGSAGADTVRQREDVLVYFDVGVSNGPVEAINDRFEHLRGIALGFRNPNHCIWRSHSIFSGQLQTRINAL